MKTITFEMRPYSYNPENKDWGSLTLLVDGEFGVDCEINLYRWEEASEERKEEEMFSLVRCVKDLEKTLLKKEADFADPTFYQKWYEYEFFIDGEDAREFIERVPRTRYSRLIQSMMAVEYGWRYYKRLRAHDFREQVSADLAYWRGYLAGMDLNSPWNAEGREAIHCMDLDLEEGKKYCYDYD